MKNRSASLEDKFYLSANFNQNYITKFRRVTFSIDSQPNTKRGTCNVEIERVCMCVYIVWCFGVWAPKGA